MARHSSSTYAPTDKPLFLLLVILIAASPIVMSSFLDVALDLVHPLIFDPTTLPRTVFMQTMTCIMAVTWGALYVAGKPVKRLSWHYALFALFLIWATISTIISIDPAVAFFGMYTRYNGLFSYLLYFVLILVISQITFDRDRFKTIMLAWIFGAIPACLYSFMQATGLDPVSWGTSYHERIGSTFGNPNMMGAFIITPAIMACGLALKEKGFGLRTALWLCWIMMALAAGLTFNRSTWVILALACVLLAIRHVFVSRQAGQRPFALPDILPVITIVALIAFLASSLADIGQVNADGRLRSLLEKDTWINNSRIAIWTACLHALMDRPWFGWGLDNINIALTTHFYPAISIAYDAPNINIDSAHNLIVQQLVSTGFIGTLLIFGFYVSVYLSVLKTQRRLDRNSHLHLLVLAGIAHMIQMMAVPESTINQTYLIILLGIQLSVANQLKYPARVSDKPRVPRALRVTACGLVAICCIGLVSVPFAAARTDHLYSVAMTTAGKQRFDIFSQLQRENPYNCNYPWKAMIKARPHFEEASDQVFILKQLAYGDQAVKNHPHNPTLKSIYLLNLLYALDANTKHLYKSEVPGRSLDQATIDLLSQRTQELSRELHKEFPSFPYATYLAGYTQALTTDDPAYTEARALLQKSLDQSQCTFDEAKDLLNNLASRP